MEIKKRSEILSDIIAEGKKHKTGWKASIGVDPHIQSQDYYIFHPNVGCYLVKEYEKNPYKRHGYGGKLARNLDDEIINSISDTSGDFGIIEGNMQKILKHMQKGMTAKEILSEGLHGRDLGVRVPILGKAETQKPSFSILRDSFLDKQKPLDHRFQKLLQSDGTYTNYG